MRRVAAFSGSLWLPRWRVDTPGDAPNRFFERRCFPGDLRAELGKPAIDAFPEAHEPFKRQLDVSLDDLELCVDPQSETLHAIFERRKPTIVLIEPAIDAIEPHIDAIESHIDAIESHIDAIESTVDTIEPVVDAIQAVVDAIQPAVDRVEAPVDPVEPLVHCVEPPIDFVKPAVDAIQPLIDAIEPAVDADESSVQPPLERGHVLGELLTRHLVAHSLNSTPAQ